MWGCQLCPRLLYIDVYRQCNAFGLDMYIGLLYGWVFTEIKIQDADRMGRLARPVHDL